MISKDSYENVKEKWLPELKSHHCTKVLLVGTKIDMRDDPTITSKGLKVMTPEDGESIVAMHKEVIGYAECSALTQDGLKNVFDQAIRIALTKPEESADGCCTTM